ncbi:GIY-YIG nuclease family protein [Paenarthrobacter sp. NPDC089989]|uniref:GIY-YIG nuclease family protein n=1 Tax=unclassified Paenarthrobacter TaxID=2634190 RepID=UPI0037F9C8DE
MTAPEPSRHLHEILRTLSGEHWPITRAKERVRPVPGLYAIYGNIGAWIDLGLDPQPGTALYVGKSEDNLVRREVDTHFAADSAKKPATGSSTVRRSFAALLRDPLSLDAVPRNPDKPGHFSNYGLTPDGDARLTAWMHEHLSLAVWEMPAWLAGQLAAVEIEVIQHWAPPLNIKNNPHSLPRLRLARELMARQASAHASVGSAQANPAPAVPPGVEHVQATNGLTPVELARELGKNPKTVRQALRDKYGRLPFDGARWGALTTEQEHYLRIRFR